MKNKSYSEDDLRARRYPSMVKARKVWFCDYCSKEIKKGELVEHSHTADMTGLIELCAACAEVFDQKQSNMEL